MKWASASWPLCWAWVLFGVYFATPGQATININPEQADEPALTSSNGPAPIADISTYHPDDYDCPLPCTDLSNTHSWITYLTVERLNRCTEPLLIQLASGVSQLVDDPESTILIRACSLKTISSPNGTGASARLPAPAPDLNIPVENPKKSNDIVLSSLEVAPACLSNGTEVRNGTSIPRVGYSGDETANPRQIANLVQGLGAFFSTPGNCGENIMFAYHNHTVAGAYIGERLGKGTIGSAISALTTLLFDDRPLEAARTLVQLCDKSRPAERSFGIAMEFGDSIVRTLASVQRSVLAWSKGTCVKVERSEALGGSKVFEIAGGDMENKSKPGLRTSQVF